jgi:proline dehydrogenase
MGATRALLLAASQNRFLRERASRYAFVKKSVSRFMPGETLDEAIAAARKLKQQNIATVLTHLGENISDQQEAEKVTLHYLQVLEKLHSENPETEISVKLTQLGLDLSAQLCEQNVRRLLDAENPGRTLWIDMEASGYVVATLGIYRNLLSTHPNTGICLQAYLHRTAADVDALLPMKPTIRLVKGAYAEPPNVAMQNKNIVDVSYFTLAQRLLRAQVGGDVARAAFATHDAALIGKITDFAAAENIVKNQVEVQMLYGIQRAEQIRLANCGWRSGVLVAYGDYWYPWFMRRLAERPANLWFVVRNLASN